VLRLHRLLDHADQARREFIQIRLVTAGRGEVGEGLGRVVLFAVEAAVNHVLHPAAQRREQRGNGERGDDSDHFGPLLAGDGAEQALQQHDAEEVDQPQRCGEHAVDQRPANDNVNVPQPVAQDRDSDRHWEDK